MKLPWSLVLTPSKVQLYLHTPVTYPASPRLLVLSQMGLM